VIPFAQDTPEKKRTVEESLLTVRDVARLLKMSERWVHERTRRREIPCYRFGTALRFDRSEILSWMDQWREGRGDRVGGEMALVQRGDRWCIRYYGPDGRQRWETIGPNKKKAETVLAQRIYEVRSGKYPILRRRSRMRFSDFAEEWLENYAKAHVRANTSPTR
jgi:excisionase family DNA binding protein